MRGLWERRLRLWSGLIIAAFVVTHLFNHALGLVSLQAMESTRRVLNDVWYNPVLFSALAVHFLAGLYALYDRSTLRMPSWEAAQIVLGLAVPPLIAGHVIGTAVAPLFIDMRTTYEYVVAVQWLNPRYGIQQVILTLVVWGHLCVGLHYWLRLKAWYRRWQPHLYVAAVVVPVLSLLGFLVVGRQVMDRVAADPAYLPRLMRPIDGADPAVVDALLAAEWQSWIVMALLLAVALGARAARRAYRNRHGLYRVSVTGIPRPLRGPVGQSLLDTLRDAGIPHAAVCGGRGRCTTCRVLVADGLADLPAPQDVERLALQRIMADPSVRLACQTVPRRDLTITPLLPPDTTTSQANRPGGIQGREQEVTTMFLDLRGSTRLGEEKLPFDVLFILNQYFAEMAEVLEETGGHYAQFSGDGLMALYGLQGGVVGGCRDALRGAAAMLDRLDALNERLTRELREPLRMGVGIHCGVAIVGTMGPPTAQNFSAIGDNVNIAARLESLTKEYGCAVVVSAVVAERAGLDVAGLARHVAAVRGRGEAVTVYAVDDPAALTAFPEAPG